MQIANATVYKGNRTFTNALQFSMPSTRQLSAMADMARSSASYLQRIHGIAADKIADTLTGFRESAIGRAVASAKFSLENKFAKDAIKELDTKESLLNPPPRMRRFLAANPHLNKAVKKGVIHRYHDYTDYYQCKRIEDNPDYQTAYHGMGVEDGDDIVFTEYYNNYGLDEEKELSFEEQRSIIDAHKDMFSLFKAGINPFSKTGEKI